MPEDILTFWFEELKPAQWWKKDTAFDAMIAERFGDLHGQAVRCELHSWRRTAEGRLAEVIVLDQFSRNMFRDTTQAFSADPMALALAQEAVAAGADATLTPIQRNFLYMPYMHSESLIIHDLALDLYTRNGLQENLRFEVKHREIIARFGRYPHRNDILGRQSTREELAFLRQPGSSF